MNRHLLSVVVGTTLALSILVAPLLANAQVYKCKDSAGKTTYSGQPCEYGGKPLPLSDNTVQGERPPPDVFGESSGYAGPSGPSAECSQAQRALMESSGKPMPRGIVDANRQRGTINQLSKQVELMCGGGGVAAAGQRSPSEPKREAAAGSNPFAGGPSTLCPDGKYVRGTSCQLCPDGSFVSGGSGCQITPGGTFVQAGKPVSMCADGSYVAGRCRMGPDGKFYGD